MGRISWEFEFKHKISARDEDILTIKEDFSYKSKNYLAGAIVFGFVGGLVAFAFFMGAFNLSRPVERISFLIGGIACIVIPFVLLGLSFHYKKMVREWEIDKTQDTIIYRQVSPIMRVLKTVQISDIQSMLYLKKHKIIYQGRFGRSDPFKRCSYFSLKDETKIEFISGDIHKFHTLVTITFDEAIVEDLAEFLNVPLIIRKSYTALKIGIIFAQSLWFALIIPFNYAIIGVAPQGVLIAINVIFTIFFISTAILLFIGWRRAKKHE